MRNHILRGQSCIPRVSEFCFLFSGCHSGLSENKITVSEVHHLVSLTKRAEFSSLIPVSAIRE
jgi:hypothetical protein